MFPYKPLFKSYTIIYNFICLITISLKIAYRCYGIFFTLKVSSACYRLSKYQIFGFLIKFCESYLQWEICPVIEALEQKS